VALQVEQGLAVYFTHLFDFKRHYHPAFAGFKTGHIIKSRPGMNRGYFIPVVFVLLKIFVQGYSVRLGLYCTASAM
jgi:hypothetical protein